jgi:hypothetical protein
MKTEDGMGSRPLVRGDVISALSIAIKWTREIKAEEFKELQGILRPILKGGSEGKVNARVNEILLMLNNIEGEPSIIKNFLKQYDEATDYEAKATLVASFLELDIGEEVAREFLEKVFKATGKVIEYHSGKFGKDCTALPTIVLNEGKNTKIENVVEVVGWLFILPGLLQRVI